MPIPRYLRVFLTSLLILLGTSPVTGYAQDATPVMEMSYGGEVVASGLTNPRGMTWSADGTMFVALAGSGGPNAATEEAPTTDAIGPWTGGATAAVVQVDPSGCPVLVAGGLPSTMDALGGVLGADDVTILNDQLYAAVDGGGAVHGNPDAPGGVYLIQGDGSFELVADLSAWVRANPVAEVPEDYDPDAAGYSIVADVETNMLWVSDPNSGQVLSVTTDGSISRVADLSAGHLVPTKMALSPEGGVYVGTLTASPFTDETAKVMHVAADGTVNDVWTGLTAVTDVAVGADGTLFATELSTGNLPEPPFLVPESGRIVQQTGPNQHEIIVDGLMFPVALDTGPDGALYTSLPALGANAGEGMILRYALDGSVADESTASPMCDPIPETLAEATDDVDDAAADEVEGEQVGEVQVGIRDFLYDPEVLTIPVGTTVTWTNYDVEPHTATGLQGAFETGTIQQGESASITFDTPGTYVYVCQFHPNMEATIIVE